jgi:hypothetical protein
MIVPRKAMVAGIVVVAGFSGAVALYMFALPGFSSARPQPPGIEVAVAMWLLRHSVPATARQQHNPLGTAFRSWRTERPSRSAGTARTNQRGKGGSANADHEPTLN